MIPRRKFLEAAAAGLALTACKTKEEPPKKPQPGAPREGDIPTLTASESMAQMPKRQLGSTGVEVSLVGLGGFHIGQPKSDAESIRIIRSAVDRGVNFLDNCWDYNDGLSEERMGKALLDGYRNKAFLMTKLDGRTKKACADQLDQSLKRLRTDHVDLAQIHEVIRMSDADRVFQPDGAIEALLDAKKAGKIRFIGFTGHKSPEIHLAMLKAADDHGFKFDTVQMPINVMDAHYKSFRNQVLPVLQQKNIGIIGMKSLGSGIILKSNVVTPSECIRWSMSQPVSVLVCGCDTMAILDQAIENAISTKQPLSPQEQAAILAKTEKVAMNGEFEKFKTSDIFDGTNRNPKWLEEARL